MKKGTVKKVIVIGILVLLTGLLFCMMYAMLNLDRYGWDEWDFIENALYIVFALLVGTIYKYIYDKLKRLPSKIIISLGLSLVFMVCVFFTNNYFHYLHLNGVVFGWTDPIVPYSYFLKYDLNYKIGYGEYRYILVFVAMCLANLAIIVYFRRVVPFAKKLIHKFELKYYGPNESTVEYRIQRLLTGADYDDLINEINSMPKDAKNKDVFIKLINKYDKEESSLIELYLALFIRYREFLSRDEYLEYRKKYTERFDVPLPEVCAELDELHNYKCHIENDCTNPMAD